MQRVRVVILSLLISCSFRAVAIIGEESAIMLQLVTTTASQLNELEKLVSNTEKYTKRVQQYNELVQDEYFKAERILYLAEELTSKREIEDLGTLNYAIRDLKYSMQELHELMREYAKIKEEDREIQEKVRLNRKLNQLKQVQAKRQVRKSITARTTGRATQLTAQNTALIHETQLDMQDSQLDILKGVSTTNRLLAEELESKRVREIEKRSYYGLKNRELKE